MGKIWRAYKKFTEWEESNWIGRIWAIIWATIYLFLFIGLVYAMVGMVLESTPVREFYYAHIESPEAKQERMEKREKYLEEQETKRKKEDDKERQKRLPENLRVWQAEYDQLMGQINAAESKESKNIKKLYETLSGLSKGTIDYREAKKNLLNAKKSYERITDVLPDVSFQFSGQYDSPEMTELSSKLMAMRFLYDWRNYVSFLAGFIDEKSNVIINERYIEGEKVTFESALYNALEWMDALIESKNDIEIQAMKAGLQVREFKIKGYETIP